jgi:hypothetical protein
VEPRDSVPHLGVLPDDGPESDVPALIDHERDRESNAQAEQEQAHHTPRIDVENTTASLAGAELDRLLALSTRTRELLPTQPYDAVASDLVRESASPPSSRETAPAAAAPVDPAPSPPSPVPPPSSPVPVRDAEDPSRVPEAPAPSAPASAAPHPSAPPPAASPSQAPPAASLSQAPPPSPSQAPPPPPQRFALPSAPAEWPGARDRRRRQITIAIAVASVAAIALLIAVASSDDTPDPGPTPSATTPPPPPPPPAPTASSPPPPTPAEAEAQAALAKLRDGIGDCVRHSISTLPGTSTAIPPALKSAAGSGYTPSPGDWKTAVWSCTRFRLTMPMRFQIQWQIIKQGAEGAGLVWVDNDGDGRADRAFSFRATVPSKGEVTLGEIGPTDPSRPILAAPR